MTGNSCFMQCKPKGQYQQDVCIYTANGKITCDNDNYPWINAQQPQLMNKFEQKILEPGKDSNKYTKFIIGDMF
jgi:hypothetical protein